jgi:WD40 repeat protein
MSIQLTVAAATFWLVAVAPCAAGDVSDAEAGVSTTDEVKAIALSSDGRLLTTGHVGASIQFRLSRSLARDPIFELRDERSNAVCAIQFSAEGRWLLSEGTDGGVRLWDLVTRESVLTLGGGLDVPPHATLAPDALCIAAVQRERESSGSRHFCGLFSSRDGRLISKLKQPVERDCIFQSLAYSHDGCLLAAAGTERVSRRWVVLVWNLHDHGIVHEFMFGADETIFEKAEQPASLQFAPDGTLLAFATHDARLCVWNTKDWRTEARLSVVGPVFCFAPDSKTIATVGRGAVSEVTLWDLKSGTVRKRIPVFPSRVTCLALSPDGLTLYVGGVSRVAHGSSGGHVSVSDGGGEIERIALDKLGPR